MAKLRATAKNIRGAVERCVTAFTKKNPHRAVPTAEEAFHCARLKFEAKKPSSSAVARRRRVKIMDAARKIVGGRARAKGMRMRSPEERHRASHRARRRAQPRKRR